MRFRLQAHLLDRSEHYGSLDVLCRRADFNVHHILLETANLLESSSYYRDRSDRQEFLRRCCITQAWGPSPGKLFEVSDRDRLREAEKLAQAPLLMLVENAESDGALVRVALQLYAEAQTVQLLLKAPPTPPAFEISHGGGSDISKRLRALAQQAQQAGRWARLIGLRDSDAPAPGDWHRDARKFQEACSELSIPCVILEKRSIENYLPDNFWGAEHPLKTLSREQRDHLHHNTQNKDPWKESDPLFAGLADEVRQKLKNMDLKGNRCSFWSQFEQNFKNQPEERESLERRDWKGELEAIAKTILDEL